TLPIDAIRHLLDGAGWRFVVTGAHGQPITVSKESGAVPVGLWRALQLRDPTCIHHNCHIPARWCDVMHLEVPDRHGGPLNPANTALGCREHHRAYDQGDLQLHRNTRGDPVLREPDGPSP
ncbi:MAG: HNH endonuclease signature motif containing protein, partial [Nitriliruptorales bacterium]|nr:HNH endonuclease signature motif containing protein [Nitriliruptorales bacterium]